MQSQYAKLRIMPQHEDKCCKRVVASYIVEISKCSFATAIQLITSKINQITQDSHSYRCVIHHRGENLSLDETSLQYTQTGNNVPLELVIYYYLDNRNDAPSKCNIKTDTNDSRDNNNNTDNKQYDCFVVFFIYFYCFVFHAKHFLSIVNANFVVIPYT